MIELKPHQKLPVKFIKNNFGVILYHSTGSGKTITALSAMLQFNKDIIIIGPKSSKKAFTDELKKYKYKNKIEIYSFQKIKKLIYDKLDMFSDKCIIVDEAHHLRSPTRDNLFLSNALTTSYKIMLLTATPIINYLNDIAVLVNIIKQEDVLPVERHLFNFFYFDEDKLKINNEHLLYDKFKNAISYYEIKDDSNYPKYETFYKKVDMTKRQLEEYIRYIKKLIYEDKDITGNLLDINFDSLTPKKKNAFLSATRQLSNTVDSDINMPKIKAIFETVKDNYPSVIYSNYLKNGIFTMAKMLNEMNISFKIISGCTSSDKVDLIVNDYNKGIFKILLLSSAGSESLDLKNTKQVHIMEPHWNEPKIKQVIGRAIRYKSHTSLPKKDQFVKIYRWLSIYPKPYKNTSADEYLMDISIKKEKIYEIFKKIIINSSIENNNNNKKQHAGYYYKYQKYKTKYLNLKKI